MSFLRGSEMTKLINAFKAAKQSEKDKEVKMTEASLLENNKGRSNVNKLRMEKQRAEEEKAAAIKKLSTFKGLVITSKSDLEVMVDMGLSDATVEVDKSVSGLELRSIFEYAEKRGLYAEKEKKKKQGKMQKGKGGKGENKRD